MSPMVRHSSRPSALTLMTAVVLALATAVVPLGSADARRAAPLRLDGVSVRLPAGSTQVVTVNRTRGYHARITLWSHDDSGWHRVARARDGRVGYGGLVAPLERHQGTGTTPLGTTTLMSAFGTGPALSGWHLSWRQIAAGDYWVEDNGSAYYNRYRNKSEGGFRWDLPSSAEDSSELLSDYPTQYRISIVTGYNLAQVRHRGAGIFLHVNGSGATAGCVSAPLWFLQRLMGELDPARVPVMAVGR